MNADPRSRTFQLVLFLITLVDVVGFFGTILPAISSLSAWPAADGPQEWLALAPVTTLPLVIVLSLAWAWHLFRRGKPKRALLVSLLPVVNIAMVLLSVSYAEWSIKSWMK